MRAFLLFFTLAAAWPGAFADVALGTTRSVAGSLVVPDVKLLPSSTVVVLRHSDGTRRSTFARPDGTFKFFGVADGTYYVEVEALTFQFISIKVVVQGTSIKACSPDLPAGTEIPYPLRVAAINKMQYFEQRQSFSVLSYLKTPYGAMFAFLIASMVLMPLLKVDEEEYKEMLAEKKKFSQSITGKKD